MQGLCETRHPYTFVSIEAFKDLLALPDASSRTAPLLHKLAPSLRAALSSSNFSVFERGLVALSHLSDCVGPELNTILKVCCASLLKATTVSTYVHWLGCGICLSKCYQLQSSNYHRI